jgi:hypothetical protein
MDTPLTGRWALRSKFITTGGPHRTFRVAVWTGRIIGWLLLLVGILAALQAEFSSGATTAFRVFPPIALGLVAVVWIVVLELLLHFFDRYLSRN